MGPVFFISFFAWPEISWLAGNQLWMLFFSSVESCFGTKYRVVL